MWRLPQHTEADRVALQDQIQASERKQRTIMEEATVGKVQHRARPSGAKVMQKPLVSASSSMHYLRACKTRCLSFHRCCNKYLIDAAVASSGAYKLEPVWLCARVEANRDMPRRTRRIRQRETSETASESTHQQRETSCALPQTYESYE